MSYVKKTVIILTVLFLTISTSFGYSKEEKIRILEKYVKNINATNNLKIEKAVKKTINCLELAEEVVNSKLDEIYSSAKKERKTSFFFPLSRELSYCPDLVILVTDDYLIPEGKFEHNVVTLNYNFVKECKRSKKLGLIPSVECDETSIFNYLNHEFTHYAFSLIYKDMRFRDVILKESENCDCNKHSCQYKKLIKTLAVERRFFDEFPPTFFSYYVQSIKGCIPEPASYSQLYDKYNFIFYYSLEEYRECVLNNDCDIFKVYILGEKTGRNMNICTSRKSALRAILNVTIENEKKIFVPKVKRFIKYLKLGY